MLLDEQPRLIASVEADEELIELSASGRYVRFGNRSSWKLVDVLNGETWKDSMLTPDESLLVHFDSERAEDYQEQLERLGKCSNPKVGCPIVIWLSTETGLGSLDLPMGVFWHEPYQLALAYPDGVTGGSWSESLWRLPSYRQVE